MKKNSAPNVVFIIADDMGYGDFGVFNEGITRTPAINSMVDSGVCLTQHYSASPVCAPARAGLLTGKYPHRTGVIDTYEVLGLDRMRLDEVTIADIFKASSYSTGLVGKWHCGAMDNRYHPNNRGFNEFSGFSGGWSDYFKWQMERNKSVYKSDGTYITDTLTDEAIDFINRHQNEQFYLQVAYNAPHFPIQAPEETVKYYKDRETYTSAVSTLYAMIERMDQGIGRILETINKLGLENNTIVVFTSDNGPDFGGNGDDSLNRYNCNYRGAKTLVYEGGIRVPLIIKWPEGLEKGISCNEVIHMTDWYPTILSACNLSIPNHQDIDGINVLPLLQGDRKNRSGRKIFWQWNRFTPFIESNAAVRDGAWKLVQPDIPSVMPPNDPQYIIDLDIETKYSKLGKASCSPEKTPERDRPKPDKPLLFNMDSDPEEKNDVSQMYPEKTSNLLNDLFTWFERVEADRKRPEAG